MCQQSLYENITFKDSSFETEFKTKTSHSSSTKELSFSGTSLHTTMGLVFPTPTRKIAGERGILGYFSVNG